MAECLDLLDLGDSGLYFDETPVPGVDELMSEAACHYGEPVAEHRLLQAYFLAPEQLSVLVGLYRYYFYQHRLSDALIVAERALDVSARRLGLIGGWRSIGHVQLGEAVMQSIGLLRFHLIALKASAIVLLRLERLDEAHERLSKIVEVDERDLFGVVPLLDLITARRDADSEASQLLAA